MSLREFYRQHVRDTPMGGVARGVVRTGYAARDLVRLQLPHLAHHFWARAKAGFAGGEAAPGSIRARYQTAQNIWYRGRYVRRYYAARIGPAFPWLLRSRETSNFTYHLTRRNRAHLATALAVVLKRPVDEIAGYIDELVRDEALKERVIGRVAVLGRSVGLDPTAAFGRREGWYAIVRALKPKVVIETGVEKGLGATVLCAALLRNRDEGHPGRYFGTDIDPGAGILWEEPYRSVGEILYGDSIESLTALDEEIDLFINDSDHSAEYEAREYRVILPKMSRDGVILADNAHVTDELYTVSRENGRQFLFFREEPADHWYLGAGIGLSFR